MKGLKISRHGEWETQGNVAFDDSFLFSLQGNMDYVFVALTKESFLACSFPNVDAPSMLI